MNYIIFDLELNQEYNFKRRNKNITEVRCPFEIIQIGALKLDETFQTISTFNRLVKPDIYDSLNPYIKEMTGITMDMLNSAEPFTEVYSEFVKFVETDKSIFCVWGTADMKELFRNIHYHNLDIQLIPSEYINIQSHASRHFNCPAGTNIGLGNAVELLNLPIEKQFHDAFNDAYYTAEVFKKIQTEDMKPKKYILENHIRTPRNVHEKREIDTANLFKQFEKMFNREMTDEEKSIIKLAYIMGKTNQFGFIDSDSKGKV